MRTIIGDPWNCRAIVAISEIGITSYFRGPSGELIVELIEALWLIYKSITKSVLIQIMKSIIVCTNIVKCYFDCYGENLSVIQP